MIKREDVTKVVRDLKPHTITSVHRNNIRKKIPFVIEDHNEFVNFSEVGDFEWTEKRYSFIGVKKYHYDDQWYYYKYSVEKPEETFGIVKVDNAPFCSFDKRKTKKSFVARMERLVLQHEIEPFLFFVNRKFVKWSDIDIVFDADDCYLLLHGEEYNWFVLSHAEFNMMILPYNVEFVGPEEDDTRYMTNYNIFIDYLQSSATVIDGILHIAVPTINNEYEYNGAIYNIGAWLYENLRMYYQGKLSPERISKLSNITIYRYEYDEYGNITSSYSTKFNALDRDVYDQSVYDSMCNYTYDQLIEKSIFRFNYDGVLTDDGEYGIALLDDTLLYSKFKTSDNPIVYSQVERNPVFFSENYIFFKDGLICPDMEYQSHICNIVYADNPDSNVYDIYTFWNKDAEYIYTHYDFMDKYYLAECLTKYLKDKDLNSDEDISRKKYLEMLSNYMDYDFSDKNMYDDNVDNGKDYLFKYNPMEFNSIFHTHVSSTTISGSRANEGLSYVFANTEDRVGLKIPRLKFKDHETYVMVFVDGELIETYSEMIVFPNYFFIPVYEPFNDESQIELLFFNYVNNNEIDFIFNKSIEDKLESIIDDDDLISEGTEVHAIDGTIYKEATNGSFNETENVDDIKFEVHLPDGRVIYNYYGGFATFAKYSKLSDPKGLFSEFIRPKELKIFSQYPKRILDYKELIDETDYIAFNITYRDQESNELYLYSQALTEGSTYTAVSKRKFVYQRLHVNEKAYRLVLDKRFRYCDNQSQYMLFINGRRRLDEEFLVTIPKYDRPFWGMYLYVAKFVTPEDRIELFYVPDDVCDYNREKRIRLEENGYIEHPKQDLEIPFDNKLFMFFINGKKIPQCNLNLVDTHTLKVNKDTKSTIGLVINKMSIDVFDDYTSYLQSENVSYFDEIIDFVKDDPNLGYDELDRIFNEFTQITNTEENHVKANVATIAIINEIVRDFWVTSGYNYYETPFIYDYALDRFMYINEDGNLISPALDANLDINIIKNSLAFLYFKSIGITDENDYIEIGTILDGVDLEWEYSQRLYSNTVIVKQWLDGKEIDPNLREYHIDDVIQRDREFKLTGNNGYDQVDIRLKLQFVNGIYYGLVDEDSLQYFNDDPMDIEEMMAWYTHNGHFRPLDPNDRYNDMLGLIAFNSENDDIVFFGVDFFIEDYTIIGDTGEDDGIIVYTSDGEKHDQFTNTEFSEAINVDSPSFEIHQSNGAVLYNHYSNGDGTVNIPIAKDVLYDVDLIDVIKAADKYDGWTDDLKGSQSVNGWTPEEEKTDPSADLTYNPDTGLPNYMYEAHLQVLMGELTKVLSPKCDLTLEDYVIGNNVYFIYAAPRRILFNKDMKFQAQFILPDINDPDVIAHNRDDHTTPILTTGEFDDQNCLVKLDEYKMQYLGEFNYTNSKGYSEPYMLFRSNGFFTRLYDDYGFDIKVKGFNDTVIDPIE